jgi:hypothetical protein
MCNKTLNSTTVLQEAFNLTQEILLTHENLHPVLQEAFNLTQEILLTHENLHLYVSHD